MEMKMVLAGGGTGGHVYPALSVAEELAGRFPGLDLLFIGTRSGLESRVIPESGYRIRYVSSRGVRGKGPLGTMFTLATVSVGLFQALSILMRFRPSLVFGSGGYASASVILAASMLRCRIVLQEQNSIPGLTNRLLASRAERIYLGFEAAREHLAGRRGVLVTGNPLRRSIVGEDTDDRRSEFGLAAGPPALLVFGGSQGARNLNRAVVDYLLRTDGVQAIIQTGNRDYRWVRERLEPCAGRVYISPYISNIHHAYRAADVALTRAGALSVSELAAVGLPAVLVPYPYAADDHQTLNARHLVEAGGAVMIEDGRLSGETLGDVLDRLFADGGRLEKMKSALGAVARPDAAVRIADDIQALCGWNRNSAPCEGGGGGDG